MPSAHVLSHHAVRGAIFIHDVMGADFGLGIAQAVQRFLARCHARIVHDDMAHARFAADSLARTEVSRRKLVDGQRHKVLRPRPDQRIETGEGGGAPGDGHHCEFIDTGKREGTRADKLRGFG